MTPEHDQADETPQPIAPDSHEVTQDALTVLLFRLLRDHVPARVLEEIIKEIEYVFNCGAAAVMFSAPDHHLARYAMQFAERVTACTTDLAKSMDEAKRYFETHPFC